MMKIFLAIVLIFLTSCTLQDMQTLNPQTDLEVNKISVAADLDLEITTGQTIYVPIYSHIYFEDQDRFIYLSATLSIRNTDLTNKIIITTVDYYDSDGKLVKQYLTQPLQLAPLATTDFVVARTDKTGGSGANFIVEWVAETKVTEPVVESVMISAASTQGISFLSPGRVIKTKSNDN